MRVKNGKGYSGKEGQNKEDKELSRKGQDVYARLKGNEKRL